MSQKKYYNYFSNCVDSDFFPHSVCSRLAGKTVSIWVKSNIPCMSANNNNYSVTLFFKATVYLCHPHDSWFNKNQFFSKENKLNFCFYEIPLPVIFLFIPTVSGYDNHSSPTTFTVIGLVVITLKIVCDSPIWYVTIRDFNYQIFDHWSDLVELERIR